MVPERNASSEVEEQLAVLVRVLLQVDQHCEGEWDDDVAPGDGYARKILYSKASAKVDRTTLAEEAHIIQSLKHEVQVGGLEIL